MEIFSFQVHRALALLHLQVGTPWLFDEPDDRHCPELPVAVDDRWPGKPPKLYNYLLYGSFTRRRKREVFALG